MKSEQTNDIYCAIKDCDDKKKKCKWALVLKTDLEWSAKLLMIYYKKTENTQVDINVLFSL